MDISPEDGGEVEITTSLMDADIPCLYPASISIDFGDDIIIEAIPSAGYHFTGWSGEPTINKHRNPIITEFNNPLDLTANFAPDFIDYVSEDGTLNVSIPAETTALDKRDQPLTDIEFEVVDDPPPPYQGSVVEPAYDLEPTGATFEPPVTLAWAYDAEAIPEGVAEEDLTIAYYDENGGRWLKLESEVDPEQDLITAPIAHLTTFAILAPPAEAPLITATEETIFIISDFTISPSEVSPGEEVTISALVINESQTEGAQVLTLKIDETVAATETVDLGTGAFQAVTFTVSRSEAGTYLAELQDQSGEFTVKEATTNLAPPPPPSAAQEPPSSEINWAIMAPILVAIFLAIFLPLWRKRRRDHFDW
ncbi:MAG: hypothetical protein JW790_00330 [Dehalococcoidales bacterium]|nr:hypothetical protein [Dehalococcoidales bacterium]